MPSRFTIEDMQVAAVHYGGRCLSTEYVNSHTPLEWMCAKGHTWDSSYSIIQQGGWCPQCFRHAEKNERLEELRIIAENRGGKCLSKEYVNTSTKLKWQCRRGHTWLSLPNHIRIKGHWCRRCAIIEQKESALLKLKQLAQKNGGKYISGNYTGKLSQLKWQCRRGHVFFLRAMPVSAGKWCAECNKIERQEKALRFVSAIAEKKGGRCLSTKYIRKDKPLMWQCANGHRWSANPGHVKRGTWCKICARREQAIKVRKYNIEMLKWYAEKRGGKLLSTIYINSQKKLKWQCEEGHTWMACVSSVVVKGSWCGVCSGRKKGYSIEEVQRFAEAKNGQLLSKEYINGILPLRWRCAKGHTWTKPFSQIVSGIWCPECKERKRSGLHKKYTRIAKERGGKLISKEYEDQRTQLQWQCKKGHTWMSRPVNIRFKHWCPYCAGNKQWEPNKG